MKRSSKFILASLAAMSVAACNPPRGDTTTGGTGSESGSMSGGADTSMSGGTGTMSDTGRTGMDTTSR